MVVAPYATALAVMIDPAASAANLRRLAADRASRASTGSSTPSTTRIASANRGHRRNTTADGVVVPTYLAHHQGMTLVALANALLGDRMVERFHAEPRVQATELLLQERVPRATATIEPRPLDEMRVAAPAAVDAGAPLPLAAHALPAYAVPVERQLRDVGDQCRRRQPASGAGCR